MKGNKCDIVLINPGDRKQIYQSLGIEVAAVEPPFWLGLIATYLLNNGFTVQIIDSNAENLSPEETAERVKDLNPILAGIIVYGSQPSASTQNMTIAGKIAIAIKNISHCKLAMGGLHPSALPAQTIAEENVDFVIEGEAPYTLKPLLQSLQANDTTKYDQIPGLWYYDTEGNIIHTPKAKNIQNLNETLSHVPWDLYPMNKYKAHNWHCFHDIANRMPYAVIYTSLGCPYKCNFCCINAPFEGAGIRYRSPDLVVKEIDHLVENYGVKNIKFVDELFVLNEAHYMTIVNLLLERKYDLNIWCYARVDTVKPETLDKMKRAGFNWFALGIESANPEVRDGASKKMRERDISVVVKQIQDAGISVLGNFIFGLPDDTIETMTETLDMSLDLNCEFINFYCAMAYPGSPLYRLALKKEWRLPDQWHGFSQHSYETLPLPTQHVSAKDVLRFRDEAFHKYFEHAPYLDLVQRKFGHLVKEHLLDITKIKLKRKLFEH